MPTRTIDVIINSALGSITLQVHSWVVADGCVFFKDFDKGETTVFPLSSFICFYDKPKVNV